MPTIHCTTVFEELRIDYCCGGQLTPGGRSVPGGRGDSSASTADPWRRRSKQMELSTRGLERAKRQPGLVFPR